MNAENWIPDVPGLDHFDVPPEAMPLAKIDPEAFASEAYRAYRAENRPFRRAVGRGERFRKILLSVGAYNAKQKDAS